MTDVADTEKNEPKTMHGPPVTVIVTTKNNHATLDACLSSIVEQSYTNIETIVVDNSSDDDTKEIALKYTSNVFDKGPERSAQRNYALSLAKGKYVMIIDSDMVLSSEVVSQCVTNMESDKAHKAIIIPEESFGQGFWAQCKKLERSFYVGQDAIEAARFFDAASYRKLGGYNEDLTGGEDWDLTKRFRGLGLISRCEAYIYHDEGHPKFTRTVKKMYYYGRHASQYFEVNPTQSAMTDQSGPLQRYKLFLSKPGTLFKNPAVGAGVLTLKTAEYAAGGVGMLTGKLRRNAT